MMHPNGALTGRVDNAREFDPDEMNVEDFSCGMITFENGAKVAWAANIRESSYIRLIGKKRGIYLPECKAYFGEKGEETINTEECPYDTPFAGHMYIADNMRKVLKGDADLAVKPEETLNVSRIIELFYKSAELGREVSADELYITK